MLFSILIPHRDEERAERELARRRARAELFRPRPHRDPSLEPAYETMRSRFGA